MSSPQQIFLFYVKKQKLFSSFMLSNDEYRDIKWKFDNVPENLSGQQHQNYKRSLMPTYEQRTRTLFSTHHYNKINSSQRQYSSSCYSNRRH
ncbi:unnamed protein product [Rotaria magnacalcarata]|uniref:Uncharacterized protein n=1 Tax=Rotaria magnacalcarata TaxID=392030 RepID=A0A820C1S4_9BILA|nr:unnamed protein product [Rotaria magnacalcarata]CAF4200453.1 unnamed protein product [Rotaria magnacalcarata]